MGMAFRSNQRLQQLNPIDSCLHVTTEQWSNPILVSFSGPIPLKRMPVRLTDLAPGQTWLGHLRCDRFPANLVATVRHHRPYADLDSGCLRFQHFVTNLVHYFGY